jgi:hypothetical protein
MASPDLHTAKLYHDAQFDPDCKVVAVGRIFGGGSLTATSGTLTDEPSKFDCTELLISTCVITKVRYMLILLLYYFMVALICFL